MKKIFFLTLLLFSIRGNNRSQSVVDSIGIPVNMRDIERIYPLCDSARTLLYKQGFIVLTDQHYKDRYLSSLYFSLFGRGGSFVSTILPTNKRQTWSSHKPPSCPKFLKLSIVNVWTIFFRSLLILPDRFGRKAMPYRPISRVHLQVLAMTWKILPGLLPLNKIIRILLPALPWLFFLCRCLK